jgi:8-oxo-dGTP pyrophosphatase MutT (NUDIX family)
VLHSDIEAEIATLSTRYNPPRRVVADLNVKPFRPLSSRDRIGEVCMVVRRRNGTLITAIKTFYPPGAFRLLTGGVDHGEAIEAALLRETFEETGLDVVVRRFLAVIEYRSPHMPDLAFATFAFLVDEISGTFGVQDETEQLGEFREIAVDELPVVANTLDRIGDGFHDEIEGKWRDWGQFRAVVHRVVYDALREERTEN